MKTFFTIFALLLFSCKAIAQPIHGHPQKASYVTPAEYPTISVQGHWAPGENPIATENGAPIILDITKGTLGTSTLSHVHFDLIKCPIYAELTGSIVCQFAIRLFQLTGEALLKPIEQEGVRDIFWDATTSSTAPILRCNTMLCSWTGHFTLDPSLPTRWHTDHGWWSPFLSVQTNFDNGDSINVRMLVPFYSMLNPNAPETNNGVGPLLSARTSPKSSRHPEDKWGDNLVETSQYLPIVPITQPYHTVFITAGYGGQLTGAHFEQRSDLDLHNHNGGRIISEILRDGDINTNVVFDPTILGNGIHRMAIMRNQLSNEGNDAVNTLLVFDVSISDSEPVHTAAIPNVVGLQEINARAALANLQLVARSIPLASPLPIGQVISQSPVVGTIVDVQSTVDITVSTGITSTPVWETFTPFFQRLVTSGQPTKYRICESPNVCKEF